MKEVVLRLDNIHVRYGGIHALKGVSLILSKGEIVTLIGANGAGKSTLLKAIMGLEPLAEGVITYENKVIFQAFSDSGERPVSTPAHCLPGMGLVLVPEGRGIFPELTVKENLEMGAFLQRDKVNIQRSLEEVYEWFPVLKDRSSQRAGFLSGGELQMLAIGRAMMSQPRVLLLDEPGLGLAPIMVQKIFEIINKLNKEKGLSVLLVEQNARQALKVADRGYVLEIGKITLSGSGQDLLDNPEVKKAYLGG
ncbi:ABC transporter ATP-binding protein [Thermospira aquatica]|uniref:ABC transporter ATP-binding protein n=1 Tax=Thermospira aquatica TaxID=2828656 RepID=A0AAX3BC43_9SPIR|nr:ABC transporter ATP-binding protein [Thermospira aquatica]URA09754.1 ABC transporter ATP-binding protein [Thermospira aquatica]